MKVAPAPGIDANETGCVVIDGTKPVIAPVSTGAVSVYLPASTPLNPSPVKVTRLPTPSPAVSNTPLTALVASPTASPATTPTNCAFTTLTAATVVPS